jgi:hypothetical protein
MRWYSKGLAVLAFVAFIPGVSAAQSDLCLPGLPHVPDVAKAEQLRIQAEERKEREAERRSWEVRMFTVKNAVPDKALNALCIFRIEVISQPALRLVQIRAPKELMTAIEDALKRLDVSTPAAKSVDLTGYVLVVSETPDPTLMPVPASLQAVVTQLKSILPEGNVYLFDTIVTRGTVGSPVNVRGTTTQMNAIINLREGTPPVVRLDGFSSQTHNAMFNTAVDIPVGSQVIVGKTTATAPASPAGNKPRAVVLVMTAKILD